MDEKDFAEDLRREKAALRASIRERAAALDPAVLAESGRRIADSVLSSSLWRRAESVFCYVSVGVEPDTRAILCRALAEGKRLYVPKCLPGPERIMLAVRIASTEDLVPGSLGIPEPLFTPEHLPETAAARDLDLMLIPCVTADLSGNRLGHGAGYYDRFLAPRAGCASPSRHAFPVTVCLCHAALLSDRVPVDPLDVGMDFVAAGEPLD